MLLIGSAPNRHKKNSVYENLFYLFHSKVIGKRSRNLILLFVNIEYH